MKTKTDRPGLITFICVLAFIGVLLSFNYLLRLPLESRLPLMFVYVFASIFIRLFFLIGVWQMRRWGAVGYAIFAILEVLFLVVTGYSFIIRLIISALVIFVLAGYYYKMK